MLTEYILKRRPIYMPYLTAGAPSANACLRAAIGMAESGAEILELGLPFSDPTADGPVIQAAMQQALSQPGYSLAGTFAIIKGINQALPDLPLVLLTYCNPVLTGFASGAEKAGETGQAARAFLTICATSGVNGLVIPDLPFDAPEGQLLSALAPEYGIALCPLISPNIEKKRLERLLAHAQGFVYFMTGMGVTGERDALAPALDRLPEIRKNSRLPVLAGFGIHSKDQVQALKTQLDGIIVGSMNHRLLGSGTDQELEALAQKTAELVAALKS